MTTACRWAPALLALLLLGGCVTPDIGGPIAPRGDPQAGVLTLSSGRSYPVYPEDLAFTGTATYRWPDGRSYDGVWHLGQPEGMGSERLPNGERYRGTWVSGQRDGHGELVSSNGDRYVGDFSAGLRSGQGSQRSASGLYRGSWRNDMPDGQGEYFGNDGSSYSGSWQNGNRHGFGSYQDGAGNSYEGDWSGDAPEGFGVMVNADGSRYEGQRTRNQRNGYGRLEAGGFGDARGFSYEGTWLAGKRHGYGRSESPDGSVYLGEWQNGNRHGLGRSSRADGSYHDGEWQHDRSIGPGVRVDASGIEISGIWNDDLVSSGLLLLPSGQSYAGGLIKKDRVVAPQLIAWAERLSAGGDAHASLLLGRIYSDYNEPAPDPDKASRAFLLAAQAGIAEAAYRAALLDVDSISGQQRVRLLMSAAESGHTRANALLGEYYATGRYVNADTEVAVTYLERATDAGDLGARNNLAWILATYPDDLVRDGDRAVALIRPLVSLYDNWQHLDTLAAALAETGDFDQAASVQQRAIDNLSAAAPGQINSETYRNMQERLQRYQQNQPFREYGNDNR